jgi:3-oxoacyl-[acyl-carrier-protein] synthase-3
MRWSRVCVEALAHVLPAERARPRDLEQRLLPFYERFHMRPGQVEALSGVEERRFWPAGPPAPKMAHCAARAAKEALEAAALDPADVGALVYGGVCRDDLEPATACAVADAVGVRGDGMLFDVSAACLGVLSGMVLVADMIELGRIRAGLVVSAESAREIADDTIERMLAESSLETFRRCVASLTGGSAAVAVLLTAAEASYSGHRLLGGVAQAAPEHHRIARWGSREGPLGRTPWTMETDAVAVLQAGVPLGRRSWERFLGTLDWEAAAVDKVVMHQVGAAHQAAILEALGIPKEKEFSTFRTLGNTGTCALPMTASIAEKEGFFAKGDRVGLLGIGTGLNTLMLGLDW